MIEVIKIIILSKYMNVIFKSYLSVGASKEKAIIKDFLSIRFFPGHAQVSLKLINS